eukprot:scpid41650/ scgid17634/ 
MYCVCNIEEELLSVCDCARCTCVCVIAASGLLTSSHFMKCFLLTVRVQLLLCCTCSHLEFSTFSLVSKISSLPGALWLCRESHRFGCLVLFYNVPACHVRPGVFAQINIQTFLFFFM